MKLIIGVLNSDDAPIVTQSLNQAGYSVTKLATSGGFLRAGNVTIMVGVEDEKVQDALEIIRKHAHSRIQLMPITSEMSVGFIPTMPAEVRIGGATIFVLDVEQFHKF